MTINGIRGADWSALVPHNGKTQAKTQGVNAFDVSSSKTPSQTASDNYDAHNMTREQVRTMANGLYKSGAISLKDDVRMFIMSGEISPSGVEISQTDNSKIDLPKNVDTYISFLQSIGQPDLASKWQATLNDLDAVTGADGTVRVFDAEAGTPDRFVATGHPGEYLDPVTHEKYVSIADALSPGDKALVTAATGGLDLIGANGVHQVNQLAVTIALDRSMGNLTGPVTASYLQGLRSSAQQTSTLNKQQASDFVAVGKLDEARAIASQGPGIPSAVLDKALAYLTVQA